MIYNKIKLVICHLCYLIQTLYICVLYKLHSIITIDLISHIFDCDICIKDSLSLKAMCVCDWIRLLILRLDSITKSLVATRARVRHIPYLRFGVRTLDDSFRTTYLSQTYIDLNSEDRNRNIASEVFMTKRL